MVVEGSNVNFDGEGNFVGLLDANSIAVLIDHLVQTRGLEPARYIRPEPCPSYTASHAEGDVAMSQAIQHLTVIGAGVLGGQIAWHSAFKGKTVVAYDAFSRVAGEGQAAHAQYAADLPGRASAPRPRTSRPRVADLSYSSELASAVAKAELVIEAVPEVPEIKHAVYKDLAAAMPATGHPRHQLLDAAAARLRARPAAGRRSTARCTSPT